MVLRGREAGLQKKNMENIIFKTQKSTKQSHVYADGGKKYRLAVLDRSLQTDKYWCAATMETDTQIMSHVAHAGNLHQVSNGFRFFTFLGLGSELHNVTDMADISV